MLAPFVINLLLLCVLLLIIGWTLDVINGWMSPARDSVSVSSRASAVRWISERQPLLSGLRSSHARVAKIEDEAPHRVR